MKSYRICVFTAVCEEDKSFIPRYLQEMERLNLPFVIYLDRCSEETKALFNHKLCVSSYVQDDHNVEFDERAKQKIFDLIPSEYEWACALDIDEVFEKNAVLDLPNVDLVSCYWVNLWGDEKHIRIGEYFNPKPRGKFYRLTGNKWNFLDKITNGAYLLGRDATLGEISLVCVHYGLMTKELRKLHKERWDRIYIKASGRNPYGFWDYALDESKEHIIIDNPYL